MKTRSPLRLFPSVGIQASPFADDTILSAQAAVFFAGLPKSKRRKLLDLMFRLAGHPNQPGDYRAQDETGRDLQRPIVGESRSGSVLWNLFFDSTRRNENRRCHAKAAKVTKECVRFWIFAPFASFA